MDNPILIRDLLTHTAGFTYDFMLGHPAIGLYKKSGLDNYIDPETNSKQILELISKHSLRISYSHNIINNHLKLIINSKYSSAKNNFNEEQEHINIEGSPFEDVLPSIKILESYWLTDMLFMTKIKDFIQIKYGIKNIFDYKDPSRFDANDYDILNNYDPGQRYFAEINLFF